MKCPVVLLVVCGTVSSLVVDEATFRLLQAKYRERRKQERLVSIQAQIIDSLGIPPHHPNISLPEVLSPERRRRLEAALLQARPMVGLEPAEVVRRAQSFYPACEAPQGADQLLWEDPGSLRLLYNIHFPEPRGTLSVTAAKLRLYQTEPLPAGASVAVFQYLAPLGERDSKRLVESVYGHLEAGWVELDVRHSLDYWLNHRDRNFGFEVVVEDANGEFLEPRLFFRPPNCSVPPPSHPFPNLAKLLPESFLGNETLLPTLDLETTERRVLRKRHATKRCGPRQLLSFIELGLGSVIVEPLGFYTLDCAESCHHHGKTCHPRTFRTVRVKVQDDSGQVYNQALPGVAVRTCSCR